MNHLVIQDQTYRHRYDRQQLPQKGALSMPRRRVDTDLSMPFAILNRTSFRYNNFD
jgi:hypothetical protein